MAIVFISDLHLQAREPRQIAGFIQCSATRARNAEALYILGDLFEAWIGDDDPSPFNSLILKSIRKICERNIPVYIMVGNRDFLLGEKFAQTTGCQLLNDPTIIDLYGRKTLLSHGDCLCIDDEDYQRFRNHVRKPEVQQNFLAKPLWLRKFIAYRMRHASKKQTRSKEPTIMDVNQQAVYDIMTSYEVTQLIHGHTHRPTIEYFYLQGKEWVRRIVLSDWHSEGNLLTCYPTGEAHLTYFPL